MTSAQDKPVVVLCGFMGTGKSSVGELLAQTLGVDFIDTDAVIEAREGMRVADIFDKHGESRFRELEAEVCHGLDPRHGAVIATGGGMVVDARNRVHLQSLGTTVLLEASVDVIVGRVGGAGDRPMLGGDAVQSDDVARGRVEALLESRADVYHECELRLDTTRRTPAESAFDIAEMLAARARGHALVPLRVDTRPLPGRAPTLGNTRLCRVVAGRGAAAALGDWLERLDLTTSVLFLTPAHIGDVALARIAPSLDARSIPWARIAVDDGDGHKTLAQVDRILDDLAAAGAGRDSVAVAVGGGVTGDVAGFAASTYMRGIPFVQVPTSLLAQVDASVGGKVGVNHPRAKNLIGSVYQPHLVLADPDLLDTLPDGELANGMAEVIKTAIIGSPELFEQLGHEPVDGRPTTAFLDRVVAECVRVKGHIVECDPYERDLRRVLNLGHTLGHALESALAYTGLKHGEAVGLGLLAAWHLAAARGVAERHWLDATRSLLERFGLPTAVPDVDEGRVRDAIKLDKKRRSGRMTFVMPHRPGHVEVVDDVTTDELLHGMKGLS